MIKKTGFTLIETIIAATIFLIVLIIALSAFISGLKYNKTGIDRVEQVESARNTINFILNDISTSDHIYNVQNGLDLLTVRKELYQGEEIVSKIINYNAEEIDNTLYNIYQTEYPSDYDPSHPDPSKKPVFSKIIGRNVKNISVNYDNTSYMFYDVSVTTTSLLKLINMPSDYTLKSRVTRKSF